MKIATIILHKNLSNEQRVKATQEGEPLHVTVIDDYSNARDKIVEFDMIADYLLEEDMQSVEALIAVNNIAAYELNKDSTLVKIVYENGNFSLNAMQIPNPYDEASEVENHQVRLVFKVLNTDLATPTKFDELSLDINISETINEGEIALLAKQGITLTGTTWNTFSVSGSCILHIASLSSQTSFYGNKNDGFLID